MIARSVNAAADVIHRAQVNGAVTAAGLAMALESAQLLVSPEMAHEAAGVEAERDALKARVAELEARDAALLTVMERVRGMDSSVTGTDGQPTKPGCSVWGLLSDLATVRGLNRAPEHNQWSGEPYPEAACEDEPSEDPCHPCGCPKRFGRHADGCPSLAEEPADKLTALLAPADEREAARRSVDRAFPAVAEFLTDGVTRLNVPLQALREDSHDGPLHHSYRVPRDLPETGGAR